MLRYLGSLIKKLNIKRQTILSFFKNYNIFLLLFETHIKQYKYALEFAEYCEI